ncbi:HIT domain-containing protein [Candidatus Woesearchaeota archaeon]|nr:MAG: HIT domain-containing protein [Candidatus Woesearchaeota archaeon]
MKKNCIFCKIVRGEIPSQKVFEDEQVLAILDINPAVRGHTLLLPKEHYPILPLLPPDVFQHLFMRSVDLMNALREALLVQRVTLFVANGAVAGQQSPHFLMHLFPREEGDALSHLDVETGSFDQSALEEALSSLFGKALAPLARREDGMVPGKREGEGGAASSAALAGEKASAAPEHQAQRQGAPTGASTSHAPPAQGSDALAHGSGLGSDDIPIPASVHERHVLLAELLYDNPEIAEVLKEHPEKIKELIPADPKLAELFEGIDINALSDRLKKIKLFPKEQGAEGSSRGEPPGREERPRVETQEPRGSATSEGAGSQAGREEIAEQREGENERSKAGSMKPEKTEANKKKAMDLDAISSLFLRGGR